MRMFLPDNRVTS